jgi:hypothetical protein
MPLNTDDLQRLRDGIAQGWNMQHCHEIDFEAAVIELLDDALEGGETLAQSVLEQFPDAQPLGAEIDRLQELLDSTDEDDRLNEADAEVLQSVIDKLADIQADIEQSRTTAACLAAKGD